MHGAPHPRREGDEELPASLPRRFPRPRLFVPGNSRSGPGRVFLAGARTGQRQLHFLFPFRPPHTSPRNRGKRQVPAAVANSQHGGQGRRNSGKEELHQSLLRLHANRVAGRRTRRSRSRRQATNCPNLCTFQTASGWCRWSFLTIVLPHLTHQAVEYQEGTNRIFIGDVKPASFAVRMDPVANGVRLAVQFTDKVTVRTTSSNGKWVLFLGDRPMEPMEPSYHFQNPYLSELQYDDQDGVPKLILSPTSSGLNFYPALAEGGKDSAGRCAETSFPIFPGGAASAGITEPTPTSNAAHARGARPRK
jgi:hypothetical protein